MSDTTLQKEQLTAWQRWELPAFDMEKKEAIPAPDALPPAVPAPDLPTAAELEQIQQQAHDEGYHAGNQAGLEAGREAGYEAGHQAGYQAGFQQANDEARRITELVDTLNAELHQVDQQVAQSLLNLSLEISRQMVQQALKVKPELLLNVVREAIGALPHFNQHAHLIMNPADAELVRKHMGEHLAHTSWKIFEDVLMVRGGCRVETANSQIDATLATRWQRVVAAIGQDDKWLEA